MASIDELRELIRTELEAAFARRIPVSAGDPERKWDAPRDQGIAAAAELERIMLSDGTVVRTDDALAEIVEHIRAAKEVQE